MVLREESISERMFILHDSLVAHLGTYVSDIDPSQRRVRTKVSYLTDEGMWTVAFSVDDKLGHDNCMVRGPSQCANPPFRGCQCRRVENKGLVPLTPSGSCLQSAHIRTMAQFCLRIAPNNLERLSLGQEEIMLLRSSLLTYGGLNMVSVKGTGRGTVDLQRTWSSGG